MIAHRQRFLAYAVAVTIAVLFVFLSEHLKRAPRAASLVEMQVALPRAVQVMMSAGDRFLAANLAGFRALVASTENMTKDNYRIQGRVQKDAAWLNPAHEDNYYIAAAILPWNDEVDAAQYVLRHAALARPFDWQPAFYFAFNELTFHKAPGVAAEWLKRSAESSSDELQRLQLLQLAAQWAAKSEDPGLAIRLHRAMARETRYKAFSVFLEKRAVRLENLKMLNDGAILMREKTSRLPRTPAELVTERVIDEVPADPFGSTYVFGPDGVASVVQPKH